MRRIVVSLALTLVATATIAACNDEARVLTAPATPEEGTVAFVQLSNPRAAAGSLVTAVAAVRGAAGVPNVGAYTATLRFDPAGLEYVSESAIAGGMRALRATDGRVRAAGASADGFGDGRLFAVTFRVKDPAALASLELELSELTGVDFRAQLPALSVDRRLYRAR